MTDNKAIEHLLNDCSAKLHIIGETRILKELYRARKETNDDLKKLDDLITVKEFLVRFMDMPPAMLDFYNQQIWFDIYIKQVTKALKNL